MSTAVTERPAPIVEFRAQLEHRTREFAAALPSHIKPDHFERATLTAIQHNPELLKVERRSLFNSLMRCAQDGLIPDGRQAVLVVFKDRERGPIAQYFQMVGGIRKLVQQSGEITTFEQHIVHANDRFEYELGDHDYIRHVPVLGERGKPVAAYSIAKFRDGGISREIMTVEEIERVRAVSRNANSGPWVYWWPEMARKTVARRHAKRLPMASDVEAVIERDDYSAPVPSALGPGELGPRALVDPAHEPELEAPRRRGRPPGRRQRGEPMHVAYKDAPAGDESLDEASTPEAEAMSDSQLQSDTPHDDWPGQDPEQMRTGAHDETAAPDPDYQQGVRDAEAGRRGCLDKAISTNESRFRRWLEGFTSAGGKT